jgi:hypothetical protein
MTTRVAEIAGSATRGLVGAMAMSGVREFTRGLGLLAKPPPDEIADEGAPALFARVPREYRDAAIEVAHWGYGAGMGAVYGTAPRDLRRRTWFGVAYGLALWLAYDAGISRALGIRGPAPSAGQRLSIAGDHVLYGLVLASDR